MKLINKNSPRHEEHPFHILPPSYLPFAVSLVVGSFLASFVVLLHIDSFKEKVPLLSLIACPNYYGLGAFFAAFLLIIGIWVRDICNEATYQGFHTRAVQRGLRYGMVLFIASEVMFFFSFF